MNTLRCFLLLGKNGEIFRSETGTIQRWDSRYDAEEWAEEWVGDYWRVCQECALPLGEEKSDGFKEFYKSLK